MSRKWEKWTDERLKEARIFFKDHYLNECMEKYNLCKTSIVTVSRKYNIPYKKRYVKWDRDNRKRLSDLLRTGKTQAQVAKIMGTTEAAINIASVRYGMMDI